MCGFIFYRFRPSHRKRFLTVKIDNWNATSYTLDNLQPDTRYVMFIVAHNSLGSSAFSDLKVVQTLLHVAERNVTVVEDKSITNCKQVGLVSEAVLCQTAVMPTTVRELDMTPVGVIPNVSEEYIPNMNGSSFKQFILDVLSEIFPTRLDYQHTMSSEDQPMSVQEHVEMLASGVFLIPEYPRVIPSESNDYDMPVISVLDRTDGETRTVRTYAEEIDISNRELYAQRDNKNKEEGKQNEDVNEEEDEEAVGDDMNDNGYTDTYNVADDHNAVAGLRKSLEHRALHLITDSFGGNFMDGMQNDATPALPEQPLPTAGSTSMSSQEQNLQNINVSKNPQEQRIPFDQSSGGRYSKQGMFEYTLIKVACLFC